MPNNSDADAEVVFEYTGKGCVVPKDVTIVRFHPSVVEVEEEAFEVCVNLSEVMFNVGLQKIGQYAFDNCKSLSSITLPSTVTEIGNEAFNRCRNLRKVVFNEGGLQKIGADAFYLCKSLSSITLPSTVTDIGSCAFSFCNNLREIVLHEGLKKIGAGAFHDCTSLSSIIIPSTVTEISSYAFGNCCNTREVLFHGVPWEIGKDAFLYCTSMERFTFPTISSLLDNLVQTGHWDEIENEVDEVRGIVERRGSKLFMSTQAMRGGRNWNAVRESLDKIVILISYYELKEWTSIFELALWKFKLGQVDETNPNAHGKSQDVPGQEKDTTISSILCSLICCSKRCGRVEETNSGVRDLCRMDVPGPVKDTILEYLRGCS